MNDKSAYVDSDAAIKKLRYHKKRPKTKDSFSSYTDDCATTNEDDEDGIVITEEDIISPQKSTAQIITMVHTESAARNGPARKCDPNEALIVRPSMQRFMAFQSFRIPMKQRSQLVESSSTRIDVKNTLLSKEARRKHVNALRKMPLYRIKNDLKRQLSKMDKKLIRIKEENLKRRNTKKTPSPPIIKTPVHISSLFTGAIKSALRKSSAVRHSFSKRQPSMKEVFEKVSESTKNSKYSNREVSIRRELSKTRTISSRKTSKSIVRNSPSHEAEIKMIRNKESDSENEGERDGSRVKKTIKQSESKNPKQQTTKSKRKLKKQRANLRRFKQLIPIEGTDYQMEVFLEQEFIDKTRAGNIDITKDPHYVVKTNKTNDLRDEFSSYCGQKKYIKNWLFQV